MILRFAAIATVLALALAALLVATVEPLRWRATVLIRYADGEITDVKLGELLRMLRPGSGFWIQAVLDGEGLAAAVGSPFDSTEGVEAGKKIFHEHCSGCHGTDAHGVSAPSLQRRARLQHGSSDWALYRNIIDGIPGTAMAPVALSFTETWQAVSYIKYLSIDSVPGAVSKTAKQGNAGPLARFGDVSYQKLLDAERDGGDWRMYSRSYNGWRYSPLAQVNSGNVGKLRLRWIRQLPTSETRVESAPIVVNGVMFLTEPPNRVLALDARNGDVLWSFQHELTEKLSLCCGRVNRGVAVLNDKVYVGTLDAHLLALQAKTGKLVWDVKLASPKDGYSITGAPLAVRDMIVTGISGGEFGIRGFLHAVDARTGEMRWRFYTIPGPGEPGHDTWRGDSWRTGGAPTWITGSFDPNLNLLYWGVGNPAPDFDGDGRAGDNLYTNSAVAIDATSGRLVWHFQFTPHDEHDWDSNQVPVLASVNVRGAETPVIAWANRNGFYYVLDRRNGRFIAGAAFARQNWAKGLDKSGRPIPAPAAQITTGGTLTYPGVSGAVNWQSPAFNPQLGLFFVHADEGTSIFSKTGNQDVKPRPYEQFLASGTRMQGNRDTYVRALELGTGKRVWQYQSIKGQRTWWSGLLTTAGGLVFGAAGERAFALNAATGEELWSVGVGGEIPQGPITYNDAGRQLVIFISGRAVIAFSL